MAIDTLSPAADGDGFFAAELAGGVEHLQSVLAGRDVLEPKGAVLRR